MDEILKKSLAVATAGYIMYSVIIHPGGEEPHIHPENYDHLNRLNYTQYSAVVSGTSTGVPLPDYITDLGSSFVNADEYLYGITLKTSNYAS